MEQPTITAPLASSPTTIDYSDVILVIPAHNDELTLASVILKARPFVSKIIVVDDGSKDRTSEVAQSAGAEIIRFQQSVGKGAATFEGLKRAHLIGCKIALVMDGDGRYKTREIPWIITTMLKGDADVVIGSRFLEANGDVSVKQRIVQKMIRIPRGAKNKVKITDPLSGFIAFNHNALNKLDFTFSEYNFNVQLFSQFIEKDLVIQEVPVTERSYLGRKFYWDESIKTAVALPSFNEETYIAKVILGAQPYADIVIVVDDGSSDATSTIAENMGALVIKHPHNIGYGAALQTIFNVSRDLNLEAVVVMDSDGQHSPEDIRRVMEPLLNGADVVIGSRFLDATKNNIPSYRKVGMKVLDTATSAAGVKKVTDSQSGFRAYGKKAISVIDLSGSGMSAGSEILIQISDNNLNVAEVPISVRYDIGNTSSMNPVTHGFSVLGNIVALISYRRPLLAFGIPGFIMIVAGLFTELWVFAELYATNTFHYILALGSAVVLILGMLLVIVGLILNALFNILGRNAKS